MKKIRHAMTAAMLAMVGPITAIAGTTINDPMINSSSTGTYVPAPGSSAYNGWAAWIQQQLNRRDIPQTVHGVGTITVTTAAASSGTPTAAAASGPSSTLPPTGTPGQTITITNQVPHGGEQVWTYTWAVPSGGSMGSSRWVLTSSGSCSKPNCRVVITNPG